MEDYMRCSFLSILLLVFLFFTFDVEAQKRRPATQSNKNSTVAQQPAKPLSLTSD
jgi:hypothetical protein